MFRQIHIRLSRLFRDCCVVSVVCLTMFVASCSGRTHGNDNFDRDIIARLDSAIAVNPYYIDNKQRSIDSLKICATAASGGQRYGLLDALYREYYSFDYDSAARYAALKIDAATTDVDKALGALNLARAHVALGNESEAMAAMNMAVGDTVYDMVRCRYYDVMEAYCGLKGYDATDWRLKLSATLDTASSAWIYNETNLMEQQGDIDGALKLIDDNDTLLSASIHDRAITDYKRGRLKLAAGDTIGAIECIASSAGYDLVTPVRDYRSLYELAALLFDLGETESAYRYITFAIDDVNASKEIGNIMAANRMMPDIVKAYELQMMRARTRRLWMLGGMAVMAVGLAVALLVALRSRNAKAAAMTREMRLNSELSEIVDRLNIANSKLSESNRVKDAYLLQYFNLCSHYIDSLERFRTGVENAARAKGLPGVEKMLASSVGGSRELKVFYSNFDTTFLSIFPGFVEKFNDLLDPDKRIELNADGSMPNELRTYALIRLGVTDSEQIAAFLRRSLSTVYNYRVKMRNAAMCNRDEFEHKVALISC